MAFVYRIRSATTAALCFRSRRIIGHVHAHFYPSYFVLGRQVNSCKLAVLRPELLVYSLRTLSRVIEWSSRDCSGQPTFLEQRKYAGVGSISFQDGLGLSGTCALLSPA